MLEAFYELVCKQLIKYRFIEDNKYYTSTYEQTFFWFFEQFFSDLELSLSTRCGACGLDCESSEDDFVFSNGVRISPIVSPRAYLTNAVLKVRGTRSAGFGAIDGDCYRDSPLRCYVFAPEYTANIDILIHAKAVYDSSPTLGINMLYYKILLPIIKRRQMRTYHQRNSRLKKQMV